MLYRISFEEAISEASLLAEPWKALSIPQQALLLDVYQVEPPTDEHAQALSFFREEAKTDALGYPIAYPDDLPSWAAEPAHEVALFCGRRAGKTSIASFSSVYEAALGAHENYLAASQIGAAFLISQDLRTSTINLNFARGVIDQSKVLRNMVEADSAERILFKSPEPGYGQTMIAAIPPRVKSTRGPSCFFAIMDEMVAWPSDPDKADPDEVIYRTLRKAMMTFPDKKLWLVSSVGFEGIGLHYQMYKAGSHGRRLEVGDRNVGRWATLKCYWSTSAGMGNPLLSRADLVKESFEEDFEREVLSQWQPARAGAIPVELLASAIDTGVFQRAPAPGALHICVIDAAFRNDDFVVQVVHFDADGSYVQDALEVITPPDEGELNPDTIFQEVIVPLAAQYRFPLIISDQYHQESLNALASRYGLAVQRVALSATLKAQLLNGFIQLLRQHRVKLLDHTLQRYQLQQLQKIRTLTGSVQIRAPHSGKDDIAMCVLLGVSQAQWLTPLATADAQATVQTPPTLEEECLAQVVDRALEQGAAVNEALLDRVTQRVYTNPRAYRNLVTEGN